MAKLHRYFNIAVPLLFLTGALWLLFRELEHYHLSDLTRSLNDIPVSRRWWAVGLTALNYLILIGYDMLGVRYLGYRLKAWKIAVASFLSFVASYNFGALLGGTAVRYRCYSQWGLSAADVGKLVILVGLTFWIGLFGLGGAVFIYLPFPIPEHLHLLFHTARGLGLTLLAIVGVYLGLCLLRKTPLNIRGRVLPLPPFRLALTQIAIASGDVIVAASVLYVLLPQSTTVDYAHFLGIYLLALVISVVSNVPGGIGVLEVTVIMLLPPSDPRLVFGGLLVYRCIFFLLPLVGAAILFGVNELVTRHPGLRRFLFGTTSRLGSHSHAPPCHVDEPQQTVDSSPLPNPDNEQAQPPDATGDGPTGTD